VEIKEVVSSEGINSPFESGVHGDVQRDIKCDAGNMVNASATVATGAFYIGSHLMGLSSGGNYINTMLMDLARAVPTGAENAPRTLSVIYWRRVV